MLMKAIFVFLVVEAMIMNARLYIFGSMFSNFSIIPINLMFRTEYKELTPWAFLNFPSILKLTNTFISCMLLHFVLMAVLSSISEKFQTIQGK